MSELCATCSDTLCLQLPVKVLTVYDLPPVPLMCQSISRQSARLVRLRFPPPTGTKLWFSHSNKALPHRRRMTSGMHRQHVPRDLTRTESQFCAMPFTYSARSSLSAWSRERSTWPTAACTLCRMLWTWVLTSGGDRWLNPAGQGGTPHSHARCSSEGQLTSRGGGGNPLQGRPNQVRAEKSSAICRAPNSTSSGSEHAQPQLQLLQIRQHGSVPMAGQAADAQGEQWP